MLTQMLAQMLTYKNSDAPCSRLHNCTHMALSLTASLLVPMPLTCIFCLQGQLLGPGTRSVTAQAGHACLTQQRRRGKAPAAVGEGGVDECQCQCAGDAEGHYFSTYPSPECVHRSLAASHNSCRQVGQCIVCRAPQRHIGPLLM